MTESGNTRPPAATEAGCSDGRRGLRMGVEGAGGGVVHVGGRCLRSRWVRGDMGGLRAGESRHSLGSVARVLIARQLHSRSPLYPSTVGRVLRLVTTPSRPPRYVHVASSGERADNGPQSPRGRGGGGTKGSSGGIASQACPPSRVDVEESMSPYSAMTRIKTSGPKNPLHKERSMGSRQRQPLGQLGCSSRVVRSVFVLRPLLLG